MTTVIFHHTGDALSGVSIKGHAELAPEGEDILCAAVSSAAYLVANTITDVMHIPGKASATEGENASFQLLIPEADLPQCQDLLKGLRLHLENLREQYPNQIFITEV